MKDSSSWRKTARIPGIVIRHGVGRSAEIRKNAAGCQGIRGSPPWHRTGQRNSADFTTVPPRCGCGRGQIPDPGRRIPDQSRYGGDAGMREHEEWNCGPDKSRAARGSGKAGRIAEAGVPPQTLVPECEKMARHRKAERRRSTGKDVASPKGAPRKTEEDILRPCYLPLERQSQGPRPDQFLPRQRAEN